MTAAKLDVIVVGLGAYGAAVVLALARRGLSVLGIDRFDPPHAEGSSHGETRITRLAVGEGDEYVPLAMRSHELWRQLEGQAGERLMLTTGGLVLGRPAGGAAMHGRANFVAGTLAAAERFGIAHEVLDARQVAARFPAFTPASDEVGYFEPGAGLLLPERCIAVQLGLARALGATLRLEETVLGIEPGPHSVRVRTPTGNHEAARVVVAAGAWAPRLLGGRYAERLTLHRQALHWFAPTEPAPFAGGAFPVFIWMHGHGAGGFFYGLPPSPLAPDGGVKLADEQFDTVTAVPERLDRTVRPEESEALWEAHVAGRLRGLGRPAVRAMACLYTTAPGSRFIVEGHPRSERLCVISACSGHGFKHSPAIGEAVAAWMATGDKPAILAPFTNMVNGPERERNES